LRGPTKGEKILPGNLIDLALLIALVEVVSALFIFSYAASALAALVRRRGREQAHLLVAHGIVRGLDIKVAAAFLRIIESGTWGQILMFLTILFLRTLLKRIFHAEQQKTPVEADPRG
jgi:hypothetical protein